MTLREGLDSVIKDWEEWECDDDDNDEVIQKNILVCAAQRLRALLSTADSEQREWHGLVRCNKCSKVYATAPSAHYWSWNKHPYPRELCDGTFVPYERRESTRPAEQREVLSPSAYDLVVSWAIPLLERALRHNGTGGQMLPCCDGHAKLSELKLALTRPAEEREVADLRRKLEEDRAAMVRERDKWILSHNVQEARAEKAEAREAAMREAIEWALGERDDFPHRQPGEGSYWWRKELRRRAALAPAAESLAQEVVDVLKNIRPEFETGSWQANDIDALLARLGGGK